MQYDFRTILKECTKVLLVWEKIRYLKRTSKAIQHFFLKWEIKERTRSFFMWTIVWFFIYLFMCPIFFSKYTICTREDIYAVVWIGIYYLVNVYFRVAKSQQNNTCSKLSSLVVLHYSSGVYNAECVLHIQMAASSPHAFLVGRTLQGQKDN